MLKVYGIETFIYVLYEQDYLSESEKFHVLQRLALFAEGTEGEITEGTGMACFEGHPLIEVIFKQACENDAVNRTQIEQARWIRSKQQTFLRELESQ